MPTPVLRSFATTTTVIAIGSLPTLSVTSALAVVAMMGSFTIPVITILLASLAGYELSWELGQFPLITDLYDDLNLLDLNLTRWDNAIARILINLPPTNPHYDAIHGTHIDIETARRHLETFKDTLLNINSSLRYRN